MQFSIILICGFISVAVGLECPIGCNRMYKPVCGHNGKTYSNACVARRQSCLTRTAITIVSSRECSSIGVNLAGPAVCTADYSPLCGSDGKTYSNKCALRAAVAKTGKAISVVTEGECPEKCMLPCPRIYKPVCGSDGKKYGNECELRGAACKTRKAIVVVSEGDCKECRFPCTRIYMPVCGSDGTTYANECAMRGAACKSGAIVKVNDGECKFTRECRFGCPRILRPVCGSDGKRYANSCELRRASCKSGKAISVVLEKAFNADCSSCKIACKRIYAPVCGSDGKTYSNECVMRSIACKENRAIFKVLDGKCQ